MDFGYSLGVLHHVADTEGALRAAVRTLKPGAPLLVYLYYAFDNRPRWSRCSSIETFVPSVVVKLSPVEVRQWHKGSIEAPMP
jgi:hypothetical protein